MRRLVLVAGILGFGLVPAAFAADMAVKAPVVKAAQIAPYNWTGFYIGGHVGGGFGSSRWIDDPIFGGADLGSHSTSGVLGGGQVGYNWRYGMWVFGIEGDGSAADIKGSHLDFQGSDLHTKTKTIFSAAGRVGYAWDRVLLYVKGGGAWAEFNYDDFDTTTPGSPLNGASSATRSGWLIGGGIEYALYDSWSVKVEYNYLDFGDKTLAFGGGTGGAYVQTIKDQISVIKAGFNYHFWTR